MTAIEYGDDIIVIDIGFQFKDENTPGIDYILAQYQISRGAPGQVRAVIITHGHLDHIGGIPYIMPRIGNPPIYTRLLTSVLIQKRQEEFPAMPKLDIQVVEKNSTVTIGKLKVKFFAVTHTIPDSMGVIIETPYGSIVHTGDLKMDHVDGVPTRPKKTPNTTAPSRTRKCSCSWPTRPTSRNPASPSPRSRSCTRTSKQYIKNVQGRLIIATFSSLLERLLKMIEFAELYNKKVVVEGRSLKQNIEICKHLGLLKAKKETIIIGGRHRELPAGAHSHPGHRRPRRRIRRPDAHRPTRLTPRSR